MPTPTPTPAHVRPCPCPCRDGRRRRRRRHDTTRHNTTQHDATDTATPKQARLNSSAPGAHALPHCHTATPSRPLPKSPIQSRPIPARQFSPSSPVQSRQSRPVPSSSLEPLVWLAGTAEHFAAPHVSPASCTPNARSAKTPSMLTSSCLPAKPFQGLAGLVQGQHGTSAAIVLCSSRAQAKNSRPLQNCKRLPPSAGARRFVSCSSRLVSASDPSVAHSVAHCHCSLLVPSPKIPKIPHSLSLHSLIHGPCTHKGIRILHFETTNLHRPLPKSGGFNAKNEQERKKSEKGKKNDRHYPCKPLAVQTDTAVHTSPENAQAASAGPH